MGRPLRQPLQAPSNVIGHVHKAVRDAHEQGRASGRGYVLTELEKALYDPDFDAARWLHTMNAQDSDG